MKTKIFFSLILLLSLFLRFYQLGGNPPSLSWDEASLGYNAFTILTAGKDEHGEFLPLARFIAFGDFKPPGYIYATVPSIALFGLNEFSVRFPSVLAGMLLVFISYFLTKELFASRKIALLSALFVSLSPWALQFSRVAYEANLGACLSLAAIYFFITSVKKRWRLLRSIILFVLSFYTFNANRIIAPLILLGLSVIYIRSIRLNWRWLTVAIIVAIIMLLPSIPYLSDRESKVRFQEVSIFNNVTTVQTANQRIAADNNAWWAKVTHNRRLLFAQDFLKHYFDNFSLRFLFTDGDVNPRLSVQEMGELYVWDLPFLAAGLYLLVRKKERGLLPLIVWMAIVPIPAATAKETPHALRIASILPSYQIIIAYGVYQLFNWIKEKEKFLVLSSKFFVPLVISFLLIINSYYYLHNYYIHYPVNFSGEWQYGYKQLVTYVVSVENSYDHIFITDKLGRPYIYFAFYQKYPLNSFLQDRIATRDWFGFWNVSSLGKITFGLPVSSNIPGRILLVTTDSTLPTDFRLLTSIKNLEGDTVFNIARKL